MRSLTSINNLNQLLTYAIGLLGLLGEKISQRKLARQLIENAKALRKDVQFHYYQLAEGLSFTLAYAREGMQGWVNIRHNRPKQLEFKLLASRNKIYKI